MVKRFLALAFAALLSSSALAQAILPDVVLGSTVEHKFTTHSLTTGVPTTLAGSPVVSIYQQGNTTEFTTGVTLTADYDSRTGLNRLVLDTSSGYACGNHYAAVITTGTVGGTSIAGEVVAEFNIGKSLQIPSSEPWPIIWHRGDDNAVTFAFPVLSACTGQRTAVTSSLSGLAVNLKNGPNLSQYTQAGSTLENISTLVTCVQEDSPASYTNDSTDCQNATANDVAYPATPANGDRLLFGFDGAVNGFSINVGTAMSNDGITITWKYRTSGSTWTALSGVVDGTSGFKTSGTNSVTFTKPTNGVSDTFAGQTANFWVAAEISGNPATDPLLTQVAFDIGGHFMAATAANKARIASSATDNLTYLYVNDAVLDAGSKIVVTIDDQAGGKTLVPRNALIDLDVANSTDLQTIVEAGVSNKASDGTLMTGAQGTALSGQISAIVNNVWNYVIDGTISARCAMAINMSALANAYTMTASSAPYTVTFKDPLGASNRIVGTVTSTSRGTTVTCPP